MTGAKNGNGYLGARMDVLLEARMMHYFRLDFERESQALVKNMRISWPIKYLETTPNGCMPQVWKKAVKMAVMQSKYSTCIIIIKQTQAKGTSYRGDRISHY